MKLHDQIVSLHVEASAKRFGDPKGARPHKGNHGEICLVSEAELALGASL